MQVCNAHIESHFWLGEYIYAEIEDPLYIAYFGHVSKYQ